MAIFTIASHQQGVGKTATAIHLAHGASVTGLKTLLVDFSPSCEATTILRGLPTNYRNSTAGLIESRGDLRRLSAETIRQEIRPSLDLLPSHYFLGSVLREEMNSKQAEGGSMFLRDGLESLRENYDVVVIDSSVESTLLTVNAISYADMVIVPIRDESVLFDEFLCLTSLMPTGATTPAWCFLESMLPVGRSRSTLLDRRLRFFFEKFSYLRKSADDAQTQFLGILNSHIRNSQLIAQSMAQGSTLFDLQSKITNGDRPVVTGLASDFIALVEEVVALSIPIQPVPTPLDEELVQAAG